MRRIFIIIAAVIVLAGAGVAAYFYFFSGSPTVTVAPTGSDTNLPVSENASPSVSSEAEAGSATSPSALAAATPVSARLVKITAGPVALGEVVTSTAGTASTSPESVVRYIERQSGNAFSYSTASGAITRTSNRTVPGIQSASWIPSGALAFVQYLSGADFSTVNTYALPADGSDGFFLAQNLSSVAAASTSILMLASGVNGSAASLARTDGTHSAQLFTTPLSSLRVSFAGKDRYLAFTKPSADLPGAAFLVDASGVLSRVAGPLPGLVAKASPSGTWVLISFTRGSVLHMELVKTATGEVLPLPVATIADKCVWATDESAIYCGIPMSPSSNFRYPDDWYQGAVSFSDRIWKIQVSGRYAQFVLDFSRETGGELDATALAIDPRQLTLVFVNKNDGSLWSYAL